MSVPTSLANAEVVPSSDLPRFHEFFVPVLLALQDGAERTSRDVIKQVADALDLTEEQRSQTIPSGQRRLDNRVTWALSYLNQARAVTKPRRGVFRSTDRGKLLVQSHANGVTVEELREFAEFREFQARTKTGTSPSDTEVGHLDPGSDTPLERVSAAVESLDAAVAGELVDRLLQQQPEFLEKSVLRLLVAMGYGGGESAAKHLGGPGDGGFDGVIDQDRLGLGRVYVQAKRYASDNVVGRPAVQAFVGALHHAGAVGGVFITTSRFSPDAAAFTASITPRVILIDGARLGHLMVTYGVGVQERQVFRVVEVDEDFFE